jgi:hypothetical protein
MYRAFTGEESSDAGPLENRQEGSAPQAVWWVRRDYTRIRGNGGTGRDNCPKGQAKAGRNTAKRGEKNKNSSKILLTENDRRTILLLRQQLPSQRTFQRSSPIRTPEKKVSKEYRCPYN